MRIVVVGTGYVGLVSAVCFAELGHTVVGIDIDEAKIAMLVGGKCPIYEPGLEELMRRMVASGRLTFSTDLQAVLTEDIQMVFSAVATPQGEDHAADLKAVFQVADAVAEHASSPLIFVNKSTVPVGTGKECEKRIASALLRRKKTYHIEVVSNPEFLREGMALQDSLMPDRIIVGMNAHAHARQLMEELYRPITRVGKPLLFMSRESAELVKYASNAFLATKISFINMMSELCEVTGGDVRDVAKGMGLDDRIGPRFLHAGIGYGGSCFPKDVKALIATGRSYGVDMGIVAATDAVNQRQRERFFSALLKNLHEKSTVAVWGLSFKPKTDDMRESPSVTLIPRLIDAGHSVRTYDPEAMARAATLLPKSVHYATSPLEAATGADAVILLTEWDEFRGLDLQKLKAVMNGTLLFDGRNVYEPSAVRAVGLQYRGVGVE